MTSAVQLFCLPYAGGSASSFNQWRPLLDKGVQLVPVELAGRGRRIYDPLYGSVSEAVDDVFRLISGRLTSSYALYGHSLGALVAYELALKINKLGLPPPLRLLVSGRGAPTVRVTRETFYHLLPEEEFKREIMSLGGTPAEFFRHPELLEALLPALRNDFRISELYEGPGAVEPLDYPFSVFIGKDESFTPEQAHEWRRLTSGICSVHYFPGGHFFIRTSAAGLVSTINKTLLT